MSSFLSPKYLKYHAVRGILRRGVGGEINIDTFCRACGYNLRGLKFGGRCPECGLVIAASESRDPILVPPQPAARRKIRIGLWLLVMTFIGIVLTLAAACASMFTIHPSVLAGCFLASSAMYTAGLFLTTPAAFNTRGRMLALLRTWVRRLSWCWIALHALILLAASNVLPRGADAPLSIACILLFTGAVAGTIGFLFLLSTAAWDADRDDAAKRLEGGAWGLGLFTIFTFFAMTFFISSGMAGSWFALVPGLIFAPCGIVWIGWLFLIFSGLLALERTVAWPSQALALEGGRIDRIAMKRDAIDREVHEKIRPLGDAPPPPFVPRRNVSLEE